MEPLIKPEFAVHMLNDEGKKQAYALAEEFSSLLSYVEELVPAGRERALVITKLQEACFFAKRGVAVQEKYQAK